MSVRTAPILTAATAPGVEGLIAVVTVVPTVALPAMAVNRHWLPHWLQLVRVWCKDHETVGLADNHDRWTHSVCRVWQHNRLRRVPHRRGIGHADLNAGRADAE